MKFKLPAWLTRSGLKLPTWAKVGKSAHVESGKVSVSIEADTDLSIREWFSLLGVALADADQYWLEVAYQCAKMDIQLALEGTEYDPRTANAPVEIVFTRANHWQQHLHPVGRGATRASRGQEAREHFRRIRGRLPF